MKKKGFTLIELLAVIVILAIIAIIAVPVILNVIEKSKIGAAEQSAEGYIDAVEKQIVTNKVKNENLIEEGEYTKAELDEKNVKIKGEITDAVVVVGEKGRVTQGRFCINGYSIDYDGKKATKNTEANYCSEMNSISDPCLAKVGEEYNFDYTGNVQTFNAECEGNYKLEVWGAQGGDSGNGYGGKGGYSYGEITLNESTQLYVYVGGKGKYSSYSLNTKDIGGYNGGGNLNAWTSDANNTNIGGGGGGTDIRINSTSLYARVIVAGGGGGGLYSSASDSVTASNTYGGYGGGLNGENGKGNTSYLGYGGTQTAGGSSASASSYSYNVGSFGQGGTARNDNCSPGGGGWYGGGGSGNDNATGGGGSGYVYNSSTASNYPSGCLLNSSYYLTDAATVAGNQTFKAPDGTDETGHTGNGYARITYLGK